MLPLKINLAEDRGPEIGTFEAAYELASMDTFVSGWARNTALDEMEGTSTKRLTAKELNEKYKDVEKPFTQPMSELAAFHLNEEGAKRKRLQSIIANGPEGKFYGGVKNIGASLVAHALDPVEFGAGALGGMALRGVGTIAASGAIGESTAIMKAGQVVSNVGFTGEVIENAITNAALEPFMAAQMDRAQMDYGIEDAFMNIVAGSVAFPILKVGAKKLRGLGDSTQVMAVKNSIGQVIDGFTPTPEAHVKVHEDIKFSQPKETAVLGEVRSNYKFQPLDKVAAAKNRLFFAGAKDSTLSISTPQADGLIHLSDNPNIVNNVAAHPMNDSINDITEVSIDNIKTLDLDVKEDFSSIDFSDNIKKILEEASTLREALEKLDEAEIKEDFIEKVKESGYDGFFESDSTNGHNSYQLFPEAIAKMQDEVKFKTDSSAVPDINPEMVDNIRAEATSRENELEFDVKTQKEFEPFVLPEEFKTNDFNKIETELDETVKSMDGMEKDNILSSESKKTLESVKKSKEFRTKAVDFVNDFVGCLFAGGN